MHPTKNDLPLTVREKITALLNQHLAASLDLQLQAKQAHWNVKGANFIALHGTVRWGGDPRWRSGGFAG
jgi:starvation-inducible DNA-binding protein